MHQARIAPAGSKQVHVEVIMLLRHIQEYETIVDCPSIAPEHRLMYYLQYLGGRCSTDGNEYN